VIRRVRYGIYLSILGKTRAIYRVSTKIGYSVDIMLLLVFIYNIIVLQFQICSF